MKVRRSERKEDSVGVWMKHREFSSSQCNRLIDIDAHLFLVYTDLYENLGPSFKKAGKR